MHFPLFVIGLAKAWPTFPLAETIASPAGSLVRSSAELTRTMPLWWHTTWLAALIALLSAMGFYRWIMQLSEGNARMKEIAQFVRDGAYAYLRRQYLVVLLFFAIVSVILAAMAFGLNVQHRLVPFAFLTGGFFSGLAGLFWHEDSHECLSTHGPRR